MKLTIHRLENFSDQDHIDLNKIWPEYSPPHLPLMKHTVFMLRVLMSGY
ncbi:Acetyltransferase, GNAT family [Leclercia adecarboxylata]|uniref:Acetyltransferase, GNAT family n=1 Tax=Leclercia adecarboxylata TaxID=83655 RepID=A0A4U9J0E6_9ENTR|nr:Acetyltransferase, GNAT family [Leclercia adecarboxylata]